MAVATETLSLQQKQKTKVTAVSISNVTSILLNYVSNLKVLILPSRIILIQISSSTSQVKTASTVDVTTCSWYTVQISSNYLKFQTVPN